MTAAERILARASGQASARAGGMTPEQVAYWDRAFAALVKTEDWKKDLADNFWEEGYADAKTARRRLDEGYAEYRAILTELGVAR